MSSDKRMVAVGILNILQTETGRKNSATGKVSTMTCTEISERLMEKFAIEATPKTVRENIEKLEVLYDNVGKKPYAVKYNLDKRKVFETLLYETEYANIADSKANINHIKCPPKNVCLVPQTSLLSKYTR